MLKKVIIISLFTLVSFIHPAEQKIKPETSITAAASVNQQDVIKDLNERINKVDANIKSGEFTRPVEGKFLRDSDEKLFSEITDIRLEYVNSGCIDSALAAAIHNYLIDFTLVGEVWIKFNASIQLSTIKDSLNPYL